MTKNNDGRLDHCDPIPDFIKSGIYRVFNFGNYIPVCTGTKLPLFLISFFIKFFCTPIWIEELRYNCLLLQQT